MDWEDEPVTEEEIQLLMALLLHGGCLDWDAVEKVQIDLFGPDGPSRTHCRKKRLADDCYVGGREGLGITEAGKEVVRKWNAETKSTSGGS